MAINNKFVKKVLEMTPAKRRRLRLAPTNGTPLPSALRIKGDWNKDRLILWAKERDIRSLPQLWARRKPGEPNQPLFVKVFGSFPKAKLPE